MRGETMLKKCVGRVLAALALAVSLAAPALAQGPAVGKVARIQGQVLAVGHQQTRTLAQGSEVAAGQTLVCQDQARAEVLFKDGTTLVLAPNTVMSIDRYVYDPDKGVGAAAFGLLNGAFRAVTGKLAETGHPELTVRTPLATIGVRGTDYWGGFLKAEELDVMLVKGKAVYVQNEAGTVDIVNPGDGTTVSARNQAPLPPKQWGQEKKDKAYDSVTFK